MRAYLKHFSTAWPAIGALAVILAITGLLPALAVACLSMALDAVLAGDPILWPVLGLVGVAAVQGGLHTLRSIATRRLGWRLVHTLRTRAHEHFLRVPLQSSVGSRLSALGHEADELQYGVSALVTAVRNPLTALSLVGAATWLAPDLAWKFGVLAPLLAVPGWLGGRWVKSATHTWTAAREALVTELQDQHTGLATIQDLGAQTGESSRLRQVSKAESEARARLEWIRVLPGAFVQLGVAVAVAALLLWAHPLVATGELSAGALVGFAASIALLQRPLSGLTEVWTLMNRSLAALARIETLFHRQAPEPPSTEERGFRLDHAEVPGRLAPTSISIEAGEKVAIVGPSGSGKSTLLSILAGHLQVEGVRRQPAHLLRQDPWVFHRTVAENLRMAKPDATDGELEDVLAIVGLTLERGLHGAVGERGRWLSGGERQRLCLARALLARPDALLLDEATSEVDPQGARQLAKHLSSLPATVVFACHDGHFPAVADRIIRLEAGCVVADRACA